VVFTPLMLAVNLLSWVKVRDAETGLTLTVLTGT
jgi:hypothetical protein